MTYLTNSEKKQCTEGINESSAGGRGIKEIFGYVGCVGEGLILYNGPLYRSSD